MNSITVFFFLVVWIAVVLFRFSKKQQQRAMAGTHRGDDEGEAFRRQQGSSIKFALAGVVFIIASFVVFRIGLRSGSELVVACSATGIIIGIAVFFMSLAESRRCPVCEAPIRSPLFAPARFCTVCGAQLRP